MSIPWKNLICLSVLLCGLGSAHGMDRYSYMGVSLGVPMDLDPSVERGNLTYGLDAAYFLSEDWAAVMGWGFGLEDDHKIDLALGMQGFLEMKTWVRPYLAGKFLYVLQPEKDLGWRLSAGAEWNLRVLTGLDNLQVFTETGVSQILTNTTNGDELTLEIFRLGLSWSY